MLPTEGYSWPGVLQFLHKQYENKALSQNMWFLQRKSLKDQIKQLEGRVTALQNINNDLLNRNRMLEYCLRQMKCQKSQIKQKQQQLEVKMPQRRAKPNKAHINKILSSLGIKNLIQNIQRDIQLRGLDTQLNIKQQNKLKNDKQNEIKLAKSPEYKQISITNVSQNHQDAVRDLAFINDKDILISGSQDCTMKLWNIANLQNISCMGTIREHSGPIFTLAQGANRIFSGGMEGIIRAWNFENVTQKKDINKKCCVASWSNSEDDKLEPIWQLLYSQEHKLLFSTSSQINIKAFTIAQQNNELKNNLKKSYTYTYNAIDNKHNTRAQKNEQYIPTTICIQNGLLAVGYVTSHCLSLFDVETGKSAHQIKISIQGQVSTNKIVSLNNLIIGGFEDKIVRIFDKSKMTFAFKAHEDSVTSIATTANMNQFFTCGHDGYVKLWDLRKLEPITSFNSHSKKYDESIHCISSNKRNVIASGGADAVIKLYSNL